MSEPAQGIARCYLSSVTIERRFSRAAADQTVEPLAAGVDPLAEFGPGSGKFTSLVQFGQRGSRDRAGILVKADLGIQLGLAGR
jgi:hypothetical protein